VGCGKQGWLAGPHSPFYGTYRVVFLSLFRFLSFWLEGRAARDGFGVLLEFFFEGVSVIDLSAVGFSISILYWSFLVGWVDACMDVLVCIVMDEISGSFLLFLVRSYDLAC